VVRGLNIKMKNNMQGTKSIHKGIDIIHHLYSFSQHLLFLVPCSKMEQRYGKDYEQMFIGSMVYANRQIRK
jgi:hypothetical protein